MSQVKSPPIEGAPAVGVTATYYPNPDTDDVRFGAALNTAEEWSEQELPLVMVDGSPDDKVAGALRARGAFVLPAHRLGIASQRQEGADFVIAQGGNKILTLEPEKSMAHLACKIATMLDKFSVVVIGRTEASKESMPPFQRRTEELIGWLFEHILGMPADSLAGPRGYNRQGMQHLLDYPSDTPNMNKWPYMYYTVLAAMANGERVGEIKVDLMYPKSMVEQETDNPDFDEKRYEQARMQAYILLGEESEAPQHYEAEIQRIKLLSELDAKKAVLRDMILKELTLMPKKPTIERIQEFFGKAEAIAMLFGYKGGVDADRSR